MLLLIISLSIISCTITEKENPTPIEINKEYQTIYDSIRSLKKNYIIIDKSDLKLQIFKGDSLINTFSAVFGKNYLSDKLCQGDKKTPEGLFFVRAKYPHHTWKKFIWIDYPTKNSWKKFKKAKKEGLIPNEASIGGEIGIHGTWEGEDNLVDQKVHWTHGCISVKYNEIDEIYCMVKKETPILIQK